mmetsp:Transcript_36820/g.42340  ORF Transcript_36820/g.42340 Transcript_36820/m.42340 type:complete len:258 (+) Transcript_36820:704-1477(+)
MLKTHFKQVIGKDINVHYSTVNEYFDDVKNLNVHFPVYQGDFLPYIQLEDGTFDHWVGYYSSTPVLKHMIRDVFQRLRSFKIELITAFVKFTGVDLFESKLKTLEQEASIMMHHDAITSTSPWGTLADYMTRIKSINMNLDSLEGTLLKHFTNSTEAGSNSQEKTNTLVGTKLMTIFNPSGYERTEIANFTTQTPYVQLFDSEGRIVTNAEVYLEYLAQYTSSSLNTNVREYIVAFEVTTPPFSMTKFFYKEHNAAE